MGNRQYFVGGTLDLRKVDNFRGLSGFTSVERCQRKLFNPLPLWITVWTTCQPQAKPEHLWRDSSVML
jgi:hypothetical protein